MIEKEIVAADGLGRGLWHCGVLGWVVVMAVDAMHLTNCVMMMYVLAGVDEIASPVTASS